MFTVGMAYDGGLAEDESLQQDREGEEEDQPPHQHCHPNAPYDPRMQDGRMVQRVTNGYIAIQSHGHKHTRLHGGERMDEEHLDQADSVPNLMGMNQEHRKGFGRSGGGQHQVNARQHGQKEVHRLVQGWVSPDDEEDADIAHYSNEIKDTQWQCYPVLAFLQTGDAHQEKRRLEWPPARVIKGHRQWLGHRREKRNQNPDLSIPGGLSQCLDLATIFMRRKTLKVKHKQRK